MSKLERLAELEGFGFDSEIEFLEECGCGGLIPGICTNEGCDYSEEVEPDCADGYCDICETDSVASALVLGRVEVFIVLQGQKYEGGDIMGAFTSREKAVTFIETRFPSYSKRLTEEDEWFRGSIIVSIEKETVR